MKVEFVLVGTAIVILVVIVEALRRRRLSENFALVWIGVGIAALVLAVSRPVIDAVSSAVGIAYGPTLVFSAILVFLLILCLTLSMHITRLNRRVDLLAQELALLTLETAPEEPQSHAESDDGR